MNPEQDKTSGPTAGRLARFRALPGSRTAMVAFFLTIALAAGGSAAYALWTQQGDARVAAVAGAPKPSPSPTPGGPITVTPNIKTAWAGKPSLVQPSVCTRVAGQGSGTIGIRFSWPALSTATSYVVSVKSTTGNYTYTGPVQTVGAPQATFSFPENRGTPDAAFYTNYLVRVMPMNGGTGGDPLYLIFQHRPNETNNCYHSGGTENTVMLSPLPFTALTCRLAGLNGSSSTADLPLAWTAVQGAASYRVSIRPAAANARTHGADIVTTTTSATFRFPIEQTSGKYVVRVQPMNGTTAGDPAYVTYRLGGLYDHGCEVTGESFR